MLAAYNYLHDLIWQVMKKINDILTAWIINFHSILNEELFQINVNYFVPCNKSKKKSEY